MNRAMIGKALLMSSLLLLATGLTMALVYGLLGFWIDLVRDHWHRHSLLIFLSPLVVLAFLALTWVSLLFLKEQAKLETKSDKKNSVP